MTGRRIAIAAALLLHFCALSLHAQIAKQILLQPTPQTRQQLTNALQESRERKDAHGEAVALLQLGLVDAGLGNADGARNNLLEAVRKMRAQSDLLGACFALMALSQLEAALKLPAEAISHIEKVFTLIAEAKASPAPLNVKTLVVFGGASGFPPQMFKMLDEPGTAGMMKTLMIQYSLEPMAHDQYGSALTMLGQFEKAEAELKAAKAGSAQSQGIYDFSIESHFGDLRFQQQRYDEARAHYMKALDASSKTAKLPVDTQPIRTMIYDRLARLETIAGRPEEAKRWSDKARELGKKRTDSR